MKRGWLVSIVMFLLNLPIVLADDSILGLLLGTSDDSAIFLRVIYAAMLFVFIYKVSKESIFPDDKQRKLALVFSLAFVFFIQHSTSDEVISTFGWLIAFIGPFIILYGLTGVFSGKDAKGKFTWTRFIIALVATGVLFFILMASNAFSGLIIDTPYVGGFFDEMFHDASYYIFGGLGPIGLFLMASLLLLGLMLLTGRMGGGSNKLGNLPGWLWWLIGTILIVVLLGLFGADVLSVLIPGLEYLKYLLLAAALLVPLVYILKDKRRRDRLWAWIKANPWIWWVILAIAIIILLSIFGKSLLGLLLQYWWVLVGLALLLLLIYFRKGIGRGIRGDNVYVDVVYWQIAAPANPRPAPVLRTIRHNTIGGDRTLRFYPRDPQQEVSFRVYRGRARRLWRRPLENANLTLVLQNANGGFNPLNGTTNANGELRLQFVPGNNIGNNQLTLQVIHPEIPRVRPIQPYPIQIGVLGPAPTVRLNPVSPIAVNEGQDAVFFVEVVDAGGNGNNFNRATVDVTFTPANPTQPIPVPVNGITTAGAVGIPARLQVTVPGLTQRGEPYTLVANVTNINGYANPGQLNGQIDVNAPVVNPLNVQLRQANINANVGDDVYIIVEVRENAGGPGIDTPIQIRFPNHGGLVNINGNAIGGTPGTPSVFTVGPIPGLTVGNSPYPFEVTVTAPPAGFRAPGVVNGVININAVVQPLLTIASPQVTIYEGDPAFLTMLVSDPNGDGVNCTVEIFSNRFGLIQGNAVGGGPGIPARFVNPRPINGLTAANSPYNYDYRVLNAPGYTIPAPQQSQIIINGAQLRINLVQITTTIDEGQDANFIVEVEDTNGNGVNVPINIRFDNNASPEINGTSQGAGRGVPGRMQVRVPGLINAQSPYIYHTTLTRVPAQYQNPGVVDGQIIVNPAPQLIPLTVRVLPQGINIQEGQ
ncbi:MAG: hypothetical protein Q8Q35_02690, partial [Nanoarchaeota archaeon]|nr:hypothetical protein [Nanoarchaeota archaeon]